MDGSDLGSAAALAGALGGKPEGEGRYRVSCPSCGRGNLQIRDGHTRLLSKCWNGCTFEEITAAFRERGEAKAGADDPFFHWGAVLTCSRVVSLGGAPRGSRGSCAWLR
jgi:hypothetical protein